MVENSDSKFKKIDHIGIAVKDIESHMEFYKDILKMPFLGFKTVESQKVKIAMFKIGESIIELLEPVSSDSPISKFLEKRGEGIHHLCYDVEDIEETLKHLKDNSVKLINEEPVIGAKGGKIAFLHPKSSGGVLTELSEE
ncbi:MAG: Metallothiol transferase FosB [Candidatus Heimdallarchaeota archaeon LC_3]|nr:MAG: Metallothiol transferase FosB [Candidatus Heimdallarchaeota archaeon LC_3]